MTADSEGPTTSDGLLPEISTRWSPKVFDPEPLPAEELRSLFEAARWAPSSRNEQPWRYLVAVRGDGAAFDRLADCLTGGNRDWAPQAPVLALSVAKMRFDYKDRPNRHAWHDLGMASMSLVLQARHRGLHAHFMGGFDGEKARETCRIPADHEPVAMIALGRPGTPEQAPEGVGERDPDDRTRLPLEEIVFTSEWERPRFGES
jgi:nitroreductase